jgi:hypothetical protein
MILDIAQRVENGEIAPDPKNAELMIRGYNEILARG